MPWPGQRLLGGDRGVLVSAASKLPLILRGYPVVADRPRPRQESLPGCTPPEEDASRLRRLLHVQPVEGQASRYPHERDASPTSEGTGPSRPRAVRSSMSTFDQRPRLHPAPHTGSSAPAMSNRTSPAGRPAGIHSELGSTGPLRGTATSNCEDLRNVIQHRDEHPKAGRGNGEQFS
jgi:hypothetical protein